MRACRRQRGAGAIEGNGAVAGRSAHSAFGDFGQIGDQTGQPGRILGLLGHLDAESDATAFGEFARVLYEQALLTEEGTLPDPGGFARRLSALLARLAGAAR